MLTAAMTTRTPNTTLGLAPWVEARQEATRRGRRHVVAVNHRNHTAVVLDHDDLAALEDPQADPSRDAEVRNHLRNGGFTADAADTDTLPSTSKGFLRTLSVTWRGADRCVRAAHG